MSDAGLIMRCDLHVHSRHSGPSTLPVLGRLVRECYSEPAEVYATARRRGMDLVTLTDHDSVTGALELAGRPDTFVSEEVTCIVPGGRELHLGVFDITEAQHQALQSRRRDLEALFAYAAEQRLPVCVNHPFSALTGRARRRRPASRLRRSDPRRGPQRHDVGAQQRPRARRRAAGPAGRMRRQRRAHPRLGGAGLYRRGRRVTGRTSWPACAPG